MVNKAGQKALEVHVMCLLAVLSVKKIRTEFCHNPGMLSWALSYIYCQLWVALGKFYYVIGQIFSASSEKVVQYSRNTRKISSYRIPPLLPPFLQYCSVSLFNWHINRPTPLFMGAKWAITCFTFGLPLVTFLNFDRWNASNLWRHLPFPNKASIVLRDRSEFCVWLYSDK